MNEEQVKALAYYLAGNSAHKSIKVQMNTLEGKEWVRMRNAFGINGWPLVEEVEAQLRAMFQPPGKSTGSDANLV